MQVVYSKDNINLNYLNNYVKFSIDNSKLYLYNTIYDKSLILEGNPNDLKKLITILCNGTNYANLIKNLKKITNKPEDLYEYLLQNFIIE